jgi:hypothetical protein
MTCWVKRILLKDGSLITERELRPDENRFDGPTPVVGDTVKVTYRGRTFDAKVIWGNWPGRGESLEAGTTVPLRVEEI